MKWAIRFIDTLGRVRYIHEDTSLNSPIASFDSREQAQAVADADGMFDPKERVSLVRYPVDRRFGSA